MSVMQQRQTAFKIWIGDLISSPFEKREGDMPLNYVNFKGKEISRVNLIATIVSKFENEDGTYSSITLDDSTGNVRLKTWREDSEKLKNLNVGDLVLVIGKPRNFNEEIYVIPEIVKVLKDLSWMEVRKLELTGEIGKYEGEVKVLSDEKTESVQEAEQKVVVEDVVHSEPTESLRARIITLIEKNSSEEGADLQEVISKSDLSEKECNEVVKGLLEEGEIYSPRPGKIKLID